MGFWEYMFGILVTVRQLYQLYSSLMFLKTIVRVARLQKSLQKNVKTVKMGKYEKYVSMAYCTLVKVLFFKIHLPLYIEMQFRKPILSFHIKIKLMLECSWSCTTVFEGTQMIQIIKKKKLDIWCFFQSTQQETSYIDFLVKDFSNLGPLPIVFFWLASKYDNLDNKKRQKYTLCSLVIFTNTELARSLLIMSGQCGGYSSAVGERRDCPKVIS